jgi:hypothetical protein
LCGATIVVLLEVGRGRRGRQMWLSSGILMWKRKTSIYNNEGKITSNEAWASLQLGSAMSDKAF